jgi:UDP-N-acetylglucosamine 2-epimerase
LVLENNNSWLLRSQHIYRQITVGHVEADCVLHTCFTLARRYLNRQGNDRICTWYFATKKQIAQQSAEREPNNSRQNKTVTGNTVIGRFADGGEMIEHKPGTKQQLHDELSARGDTVSIRPYILCNRTSQGNFGEGSAYLQGD